MYLKLQSESFAFYRHLGWKHTIAGQRSLCGLTKSKLNLEINFYSKLIVLNRGKVKRQFQTQIYVLA